MQQTAINYDEVLKAFVSTDHLRPALRQPNEYGEYAWASDSHSLILIPKMRLSENYPSHAKAPNVQVVLEFENSLAQPITINRAALSDLLGKLPKVPAMKSCKECDGDGEVECACCGHRDDCDECDGNGEVVDAAAPMVIDDSHYLIRINNNCFSPYYINQLLETAKALDVEKFELIAARRDGQHLFKIKEAQVIVMPRLGNENRTVYELNTSA